VDQNRDVLQGSAAFTRRSLSFRAQNAAQPSLVLIGAAEGFPGSGFLVPTRNGDLMRWCVAENLCIIQAMTLVTIGFYIEPNGSWLPSVTF
jgi:hypothetical protein